MLAVSLVLLSTPLRKSLDNVAPCSCGPLSGLNISCWVQLFVPAVNLCTIDPIPACDFRSSINSRPYGSDIFSSFRSMNTRSFSLLRFPYRGFKAPVFTKAFEDLLNTFIHEHYHCWQIPVQLALTQVPNSSDTLLTESSFHQRGIA